VSNYAYIETCGTRLEIGAVYTRAKVLCEDKECYRISYKKRSKFKDKKTNLPIYIDQEVVILKVNIVKMRKYQG
jgi:hypothetical protein